MAGLYIHIPFCKKACHYCDFHFSINFSKIFFFIEALLSEIIHKSSFLSSQFVETIYFGGGTPSVLSPQQVAIILNTIRQHHQVIENPEITFELNPDDATPSYLQSIFDIGINRLSIGVQTFDAQLLAVIQRNHTSQQSLSAIAMAQDAGFQNISIDLIYAYPAKIDTFLCNTNAILAKDLDILTSLSVSHISAYQLTVEPKTVFGKWQKSGKLEPITDNNAILQFDLVVDTLFSFGFEQYEISNFAQNGNYSKHNSAYWLGKSYLGFGPSAHSFVQTERWANVANNAVYANFWNNYEVNLLKNVQSVEVLSNKDKVNEHILTRLRTIWGIETLYINALMSEKQKVVFANELHLQKQLGNVVEINNGIFLTKLGKYVADNVALKLFLG